MDFVKGLGFNYVRNWIIWSMGSGTAAPPNKVAFPMPFKRARPGTANDGGLKFDLQWYDEAEQLLVSALETNRRLHGEEDAATLRSMVNVGQLYRDQGHYDRTGQLLLKAEETARRVFGNDREITNASVNNPVRLYQSRGKPEKAEQWRAKLPHTEAAEK